MAAAWPQGSRAASYQPSNLIPPNPPREFRAVWVASVANIDWPSSKDLSTAEQKAELLQILDRAAALNLNVVILQIRPACDALYASPIEPWSEYLTGEMGRPPKPFYDPLAFAIDEAHKRGLELHAWFNPYRARLLPAKSPAAANHISRTHPQLVRQYGKYLWLDPGEKDVQNYSLNVVMDVVKRYDIDGVHFDDYFYPYAEQDAAGNDLDFPDYASWERFGAKGKLDRADWRRENVNIFIQRVYTSVKAAKPWVKFGVSPFGIWRPGNPAQIRGYDAYSKLFADSRKWLANGWLDYFAPQLYWSIDAPEQSFPVLLKWWSQQNANSRLLVPGMDANKTLGKWKPQEIIDQIRLTRRQGAGGEILWSVKSLTHGGGLEDALKQEAFAEPALVPASPWLGTARPGKPHLTAAFSVGNLHVTVRWQSTGLERPGHWLLQTRAGGEWTTNILPGAANSHTWSTPPEAIAVSAVDRNGNVSSAAVVELKQ